MIRVRLKFKTQLVKYLERTSKSSIKKGLRNDYPNRGPEYNSRTPVCTNGPEVRKPWERSQRIFQTAGRKPLDSNGKRLGNRFR